MADKGFLSFYDKRGKATTMMVNVEELAGANMEAVQAQIATLAGAIGDIATSAHYRHGLSTDDTVGTQDNDAGLRGTKAIVRWYSITENQGEGAYGSNEIGTIDEDVFTSVGGKLILQGALYDAVKAAFDAVALTENGNAVSVYEIECVSRNLS